MRKNEEIRTYQRTEGRGLSVSVRISGTSTSESVSVIVTVADLVAILLEFVLGADAPLLVPSEAGATGGGAWSWSSTGTRDAAMPVCALIVGDFGPYLCASVSSVVFIKSVAFNGRVSSYY